MGEFLQQMPMNPGMAGNAGPGRGNAVPMQNRVSPEPTLAEIGITKKQSFQAQRRAVEVALRELGNLSDREVARVCAVSPTTVAGVRGKLSNLDSSTEARLGADGKIRKMPAMRHEPRGEVEVRGNQAAVSAAL